MTIMGAAVAMTPPTSGTASFVAAAAANTLTDQTLATMGVVVNDLLIVVTFHEGDTPVRGSGGAWIDLGPIPGTNVLRVYYALAASGDLSDNMRAAANNDGFIFVAYRSATSVSIRASAIGEIGNPLSITGFTKSGSHAGLIGMTQLVSSFHGTFTSPPAWAQRETLITSGIHNRLYDRLYPANTEYVNGTAFVTDNNSVGASGQQAAVLELLA